MSLKSKFDKYNSQSTENGLTGDEQKESDIELYEGAGHARNICFEQADTKQTFLNYAYLVSGAYTPADNIIALGFTTHTVTIKGRHLEGLYESLLDHQVRRITAMDKRYAELKNEDEISIIDINIEVAEKPI